MRLEAVAPGCRAVRSRSSVGWEQAPTPDAALREWRRKPEFLNGCPGVVIRRDTDDVELAFSVKRERVRQVVRPQWRCPDIPRRQKTAISSEDLNAPVVEIGDVDVAGLVDDHVGRAAQLAEV